MIGNPSEEDASFVTDQKAIEYLKSFPYTPRIELHNKYQGATTSAIDFLNKILVFNPFFRMSLSDALAHPLFDDVRNANSQNVIGTQIELEFEKMTLNKDSMRQLFLAEIYTYHNKQS